MSCLLTAQDWKLLQKRFQDEQSPDILLEIGRSGDERAIPFLSSLVDIEKLDYSHTLQGIEMMLFYRQTEGRALSALAMLGDPDAWLVIDRDTRHENASVRMNALFQLIDINNRQAIPYLARYLEDEPTIVMRRVPILEAIEAISNITGEDAPVTFRVQDAQDWKEIVPVYREWWRHQRFNFTLNRTIRKGLLISPEVFEVPEAMTQLREKVDFSMEANSELSIRELLEMIEKRWPGIALERCRGQLESPSNPKSFVVRRGEMSLLEIAAMVGSMGGLGIVYDHRMRLMYATADLSTRVTVID